MNYATFTANADAVARILRSIANSKRLMILCTLAEAGECNVGQLAGAVGLSQSALSQHLAKLRDEALVETRRAAQTIWYRIADPRVGALLTTLHEEFCGENNQPNHEGRHELANARSV